MKDELNAYTYQEIENRELVYLSYDIDEHRNHSQWSTTTNHILDEMDGEDGDPTVTFNRSGPACC